MKYSIETRQQHQVGGRFGGPNAYMTLIAYDGDTGPQRRYLSQVNYRRYGWTKIASREYYDDSRLGANAGIKTRQYLLGLLPAGATV